MSMAALLESLGWKHSAKDDLDKPLRVRVSKDTIDELDALEIFLVSHGHREVTRSALVRAALTSYLDGVRDEVPEALQFEPPQKRSGARGHTDLGSPQVR